MKFIISSNMQMPYQNIEINYYFLLTRCNQHNVSNLMDQGKVNVVKIPGN